ncbi:hypothetical protein CTN06_01415 [Pectobacterium zantedeschiae]|uniref:Uncharacterized protein n=1 Tax=Pectobacterium zantedeschiae TaxID=2034769 RepID=A0A9X8JK05_9GAMM|nr:hypothetical protein CLR69_05615 [Pectobacterium zantedeschiae]RYC49662.1 hypothetical protein CTN06_01415 [Pectobacterium zantedeschiae]
MCLSKNKSPSPLIFYIDIKFFNIDINAYFENRQVYKTIIDGDVSVNNLRIATGINAAFC